MQLVSTSATPRFSWIGLLGVLARLAVRRLIGFVTMGNPVFKYQASLGTCSQPCPDPGRFTPQSRTAFRFVHWPMTANDFLPVAQLDPRRGGCQAHSLSFFTSVEKARTRWQLLSERINAAKKLGEWLAQIDLTPQDGIMCAPDAHGHFDLHEYVGVAFSSRVAGHVPIIPPPPQPPGPPAGGANAP